MAGPDLPEIPAPLKSIQQYLKTASTHDSRDPVVSYWCRLYALQTGLKLSTKTSEETNFLLKLMDWLEATKKELRDNEAITNEVAAQAHLENWALKLFLYADKNDRASNFGKSVLQSFFTAALLYDVLTIFGELTEEAAQNRKYAQWKSTYIHNCLKNGETPIPGPARDDNENNDLDINTNEDPADTENNEYDAPKSDSGGLASPTTPGTTHVTHGPMDGGNFAVGQQAAQGQDYNRRAMPTQDGVDLSLEQMNKAQKFIKWAGSALNYDDVPTAVVNLQKALHLLTTGEEELA